ncbi:hypothetical protein K0U00_33390, partial [Paenibacillus sepulcri]|nr:hypothetical protein [Paenibacillus sepulcri]
MALAIRREPDMILVETDNGWQTANRSGDGIWSGGGVEITLHSRNDSCSVGLSAPLLAVKTVRLYWKQNVTGRLAVLGDHWERAYGDLEWRGIVPERVMPWYFLTNDGIVTNGYGVKTGTASLCYWQFDQDGITLSADVRCGSEGVQLGVRKLVAAEIVGYEGKEGESAFAAASRFCSVMCENPVLPDQPVYGGNNWYYAYGNSSHAEILEDSKFMASLSSSSINRPYMVIDDGWQLASGGGACNGGPWRGN